MRIDCPTREQLPALRALWTEAFGEPDFWDAFFETVFTPEHCRCIGEGDRVTAALYWLECSCRGQRYAYLYAVATGEAFRHQGLCRTLMADTRIYLQSLGFDGLLLVPENDGLRQMYAGMGYASGTQVSECTCTAGSEPVSLRRISREEYARLRQELLPEGGAIQEGENLALLEMICAFWTGEDFLMAAAMDKGRLFCRELLGNADRMPGILAALNCGTGFFRMPGGEKPYAMFSGLTKIGESPDYFGLAFE